MAGEIVSKGNGKNTYEWFDVAPSASSNFYRVISFNNNGTKDVSNIIKVVSSVKDAFRCYPNPATDFINIQFNKAKNDQTVNVRLFNNAGQLILSREFKVKSNQNIVQMVLPSSLHAGIYSIEAIIENEVLKQPIIIK